MATAQFDPSAQQATPPTFSIPPLKKGGQGGFPQRHTSKSPSIPLFQRGKQSLRSVTKHLTRRITFVVALVVFLTAPSFLQAQSLPTAEKQKIETLIKQVGDLKDAKFVRNGSAYEPATAVRFLRGKWDANKAEVKSVRDFIDKVATKSGTSGKPYLMRFNDGKDITSREFLLAELRKIES
ncbi:MAG: DUF5329 family protein [Candidatus Binatia bacterium]